MIDYIRKTYRLLGESARRRLGLLVLGFFALSLLDLMGISLIGAFLAAITSPDYFSTKAWGKLALRVNGGSIATVLVATGLTLVVLFLIKGVATYYINRAIIYFSFQEQARIRRLLLQSYLALPLDAYASESSSTLITSMNQRTVHLTNQALIPGLKAVADSMILVSILLFLLMFNWIITLATLLLFATVVLVYVALVKRRLACAGQDVIDATHGIISVVHNASHGFKEIRVLGCESFFQHLFFQSTARFAEASTFQQALAYLPRQLIEFTLVATIVLLAVVTALIQDGMISDSIATLGIFAFAGFRSIAGLNSLMVASNHLRFATRAVNDLHQQLCVPKAKSQESEPPVNSDETGQTLSFERGFRAEEVTYRYPNSKSAALNSVSMSVPKGGSIGIIGRSGSGKTTLVDVLLGLLRPQEGSVMVDGCDIHGRERAWMSRVAYIPQGVFLLDASVAENIALGEAIGVIDKERLDAALQLAQLREVIACLPEGLDTVVGERGVRLSGGQRQRIALARAFYNERDVIVMDEATASLDNETERQVIEAIKNLRGKKTVIVIAHRLTTVKHCDVIYKLEAGSVFASGTYEQVVGEEAAG